MSKTWVVVADNARARFFEVGRSRNELLEIDDMVNPDARLHERDLVADDKGRSYDSFGKGRHAVENKSSAKQQQAVEFAKGVNDRLLAGLGEHKFERLYLMAPPEFLGILRNKLDPKIEKLVAAEINKGLTQHPVSDIAKHLT